MTTDHKILSVVYVSRNGHRNALILQDEYTNWIQSYFWEEHRCIRNCIMSAQISSFESEARNNRHGKFEGVS